ncbi:MAG TPA: nuclear transport factor 2 family protein [Mycobacteriales bacterium]|nr:nuclear transport factor 2 family protein [Mycobacteriales bacterium]
MGRDSQNRTALERHWAASVAGDLDTEHEIYHDDVVVEYPQSGERIRGRDSLRAVRVHHPSRMEYAVQRITGHGDVWVTEGVSGYGPSTVRTVSVMEFRDGRVLRETQYFAEPFDAPQWRMPWVETGELSEDWSDGTDDGSA